MRFTDRMGTGGVASGRREGRHCGDVQAAPAGAELPAVVGTLEPAFAVDQRDAAERQPRAAVRTAVVESMHCTRAIAPQHQFGTQQRHRERLLTQRMHRGHRVPPCLFQHRLSQPSRICQEKRRPGTNPGAASPRSALALPEPYFDEGSLPSTPFR
jgi:hypothetical protein